MAVLRGSGVMPVAVVPSGSSVLGVPLVASFLERTTVGIKALDTYRNSVREFLTWCQTSRLDWADLIQLDHLVALSWTKCSSRAEVPTMRAASQLC